MDHHKYNASKLFNVPIEEVTPKQRRVSKAWFFARNYSSGEINLGRLVGQYPIMYDPDIEGKDND